MPLPIFRIARLTNATTGATSAQDTAEFIDLTGTIPIRTQETQRLTYPGTDDHALRRTGRRGSEFTLTSLEYQPTIGDAFARLAAYEGALKTGNLLGVRLWQNDANDWPFDVLDVQFAAQPKGGVRPATARAVPQGLAAELRLTWRLVGRGRP